MGLRRVLHRLSTDLGVACRILRDSSTRYTASVIDPFTVMWYLLRRRLKANGPDPGKGSSRS